MKNGQIRGEAQRAGRVLRFYIKALWERPGGKWNSDHDAEIDGIIEDLWQGIEKEIDSRIEQALKNHVWKYHSDGRILR